MLRGPSRPDLLREECLPDILRSTAARRPDHPALIWGQRVVTYQELDARSDALACALASKGAGAGRMVGLFMPRSADLLIAQAAISKSGAAWLPLDASTPPERVASCLQSAGAVGLVTCRDWVHRLQGLPTPIWAVEDLSAPADACELEHLRDALLPADPAYVIYTSGSTGKPKGIAVSHRSICHLLRSENKILGVRPDDRVYQGFSLAFDMSFEEIWIAYLVGATVWIAPRELVGDPDRLAYELTFHRITVMHAVPTLMGLIDAPLPTVRLINLGGEACPDALVDRLARPGRRLFNTYGPTEATVSASIAALEPGQPVTIGTPLPNYGLVVTDEQQRPVPRGEVGELCIFGPGVAIGYLGQAELTAQRFVPYASGQGPDEDRLYLTGDLAKIDDEGLVHYLGRADGQVKIRGYRVELGEIESAIAAQDGVAAAAVVLRTVAEVSQLVAFVVPAAGGEVVPSTLRRALESRYCRPTWCPRISRWSSSFHV